MKHEIVYAEQYALIVSDGEIKEGDCYLSPSGIWFYNHLNPNHVKECKKVIGHRPLTDAPILEGAPLLPEFSQEGDVKKLSLEVGLEYYIGGNYDFENGVRKGYNKAKETYKYTEEDIQKAFIAGEERIINKPNSSELDNFTNFIQSLQQSKLPKSILLETVGDTETINRCKNFNIEIGCVASRCTCENLSISKTITNSKGQTELVGEYIYE